MFEKLNIIEGLTVIGVIVIALYAIMQSNSELAAAAAGGLVGYLTRAVSAP